MFFQINYFLKKSVNNFTLCGVLGVFVSGYQLFPLLIILIEGFVTISFQVLTLRQLVPFVGNNIYSTSLIIGFFLLFLALGYKKGGQIKENIEVRLAVNFLLSLLLIGIGLSYSFIDLLFTHVLFFTENYLFKLFIYLLLIIAPGVYLLGQTIPAMTNMSKQKDVSEVSGNSLYLSTIGSFLGAVLTSFLFLSFFGVGLTIFLVSLMLFVLVVLSFRGGSVSFWLIGLMLLLSSYYLNAQGEKELFIKTTVHANYEKKSTQDRYASGRLAPTKSELLISNGSYSSVVRADGKGWSYIERAKDFVSADLQLKGGEIAIVGAGAFSYGRGKNSPGIDNKLTFIDVDEQLEPLIREKFQGSFVGDFIGEDARLYFKHSTKKYDVIVLDAYSSKSVIPPHLVTAEFYSLVKSRIKDGGWLLVNMILDPQYRDNFSQRMDNTLRSVYPHCYTEYVRNVNGSKPNLNRLSNILYICPVGSKQVSSTNIYTDDKNLSSLDLAH